MGKRKKKLIFIEHAMMEVAEDDYERGEIGPRQMVWSSDSIGMASDLAGIVAGIQVHGPNVPEDPSAWIAFEDGRLDCNFLVDSENYRAYPADIEAWKRGEKKLYSATVYVLISFAEVWKPTDEEIAKRLGVETYD